MGTSRTADEALEHYIQTMGAQLGTVYHHLWQELAWLYAKWNEYVTLYGSNPSRVALVNKVAPQFFRVLQDALWEDTILHIARMTDPPKSAGKTNLSIRQLPELVEDEDLASHLNELVERAISASAFCRDWRNRRLAHRDLDLATGATAIPLTGASREKVKTSLQSLVDVMDAVSTHYLESSTLFDMGANFGGAELLLRALNDGIRAREERAERIRKGEIRPEDLHRPDL